MLGFMGSQRVGHNWATELNLTELNIPEWSSGFPYLFNLSLNLVIRSS